MKKSKLIYCSVAAVIAIIGTKYSSEIRTSEQGLAIIGDAEGCRQQSYICPAGYWTYGIGTAETSGEKIEKNKIYTLDEIAKSWVNNIKIAEQCVNRYANGQKQPQGTFDALVSITFNTGCAAMRKSTLFKMANHGYSAAMCEQFNRWVYAGGQKLAGLVKRRQQERVLCLQN
ncbi:lysozyme [Actinobacillus lignieresii]|uniref:Lysozyme n=1 Tax=Actinobacillus lignieresii TaxID=720 RepID=A0A380TT26_ACTLI|nr:lysozyme [Actinobacillus lignieresii]SUT91566.1 endolysin [Actinobacillus lignieresii]